MTRAGDVRRADRLDNAAGHRGRGAPRRRRHADHTGLATPAGATDDAAAIEEQMPLRVISPLLSGDGGG